MRDGNGVSGPGFMVRWLTLGIAACLFLGSRSLGAPSGNSAVANPSAPSVRMKGPTETIADLGLPRTGGPRPLTFRSGFYLPDGFRAEKIRMTESGNIILFDRSHVYFLDDRGNVLWTVVAPPGARFPTFQGKPLLIRDVLPDTRGDSIYLVSEWIPGWEPMVVELERNGSATRVLTWKLTDNGEPDTTRDVAGFHLVNGWIVAVMRDARRCWMNLGHPGSKEPTDDVYGDDLAIEALAGADSQLRVRLAKPDWEIKAGRRDSIRKALERRAQRVKPWLRRQFRLEGLPFSNVRPGGNGPHLSRQGWLKQGTADGDAVLIMGIMNPGNVPASEYFNRENPPEAERGFIAWYNTKGDLLRTFYLARRETAAIRAATVAVFNRALNAVELWTLDR